MHWAPPITCVIRPQADILTVYRFWCHHSMVQFMEIFGRLICSCQIDGKKYYKGLSNVAKQKQCLHMALRHRRKLDYYERYIGLTRLKLLISKPTTTIQTKIVFAELWVGEYSYQTSLTKLHQLMMRRVTNIDHCVIV